MSGISALSNSNFSGESRILNEATQAILDFEKYQNMGADDEEDDDQQYTPEEVREEHLSQQKSNSGLGHISNSS